MIYLVRHPQWSSANVAVFLEPGRDWRDGGHGYVSQQFATMLVETGMAVWDTPAKPEPEKPKAKPNPKRVRDIGEKFVETEYCYDGLCNGIVIAEVEDIEYVVSEHRDVYDHKGRLVKAAVVECTGSKKRRLTDLEERCMHNYMKAASVGLLSEGAFNQLIAASVAEGRVITFGEILDMT